MITKRRKPTMKKSIDLQPGDFALTTFGGQAKKVRIVARKEADALNSVRFTVEPEVSNGPCWFAAAWFRPVEEK
jgi:hypothetical protein